MSQTSSLETAVALARTEGNRTCIAWGAPIALAIALAAALPSPICANAKGSMTMLIPEDREIQLALSAGPVHVRAAAAVYVYGASGYRLVRSGTNGFTCFVNRDGNQAGDHDLKPTCWDAEGSRTIVPVMLRVGEMIAATATAGDIQKDIDAGFASGRFTSPRKNGIAYMLAGDIPFDPVTGQIGPSTVPPHYMLYAPGVTNADIGTEVAPSEGDPRLPQVYSGYSGGPRTAYIIILATSRMTR